MGPEIECLDDQMDDGDSSPPPSNHADSPVANASGSQTQSKKSVQRGARACQVCRAAKMRCLGGDDQQSDINPCNRCKKSNLQCIFEKHRRGRKPGSKISEAGKARRMERVNEVRMKATSARLPSPIQGHNSYGTGGGSDEASGSMPSLTSAAANGHYVRQKQQQLSTHPFPKLEESGSVNLSGAGKMSEDEGQDQEQDMETDDGSGGPPSMQRQEQQQQQQRPNAVDRRMQQQPSSYSSTANPSPTIMAALPASHHPQTSHSHSMHSHSNSQSQSQSQPHPNNNTMVASSSRGIPAGNGVGNHSQQHPYPGPYAPPPLEVAALAPMQQQQQQQQQQQMQQMQQNLFDARPETPRERKHEREGARTVVPPQRQHQNQNAHNHRRMPSIGPHQLPPLQTIIPPGTPRSRSHLPPSEDTDDLRADDDLYPRAMLARERTRQSFLATVLGPSTANGALGSPSLGRRDSVIGMGTPGPRLSGMNGFRNGRSGRGDGSSSLPPNTARSLSDTDDAMDGHMGDAPLGRMGSETEIPLPPEFATSRVPLKDPIDLGIVAFEEAEALFIKFFEHLNPCVNLFNPKLHTVTYIRSKSKFLFTVMMMACCKYFKPGVMRTLQQMCQAFTSRCMDEQHKSVEVVQAFSCLTYWKELEDNRTWIFVGYACRVAFELGLDKYVEKPPAGETETQYLERRNRERTFLVLFVHDRSLSMQTGRPWMIPEGRLIEESVTWHQNSDLPREDAVIASFVQLRRMSAEVTDVFFMQKRGHKSYDIDFRILLGGANRRLNEWEDYWEPEMLKAGGTDFHVNFLRLFKLHVRLFLNSLGLDNSPKAYKPGPKNELNDTALALCYTSAQDSLDVVTKFKDMGSLRYGQDVLAVMAAYAALFLLRLLRRAGDSYADYLKPEDVYDSIEKTANAFKDSHVKGVPRFIHNLAKGFREMDGQQGRRSESVAGAPQDSGGSQSAPSLVSQKSVGSFDADQRGNTGMTAGPSRHAHSGSVSGPPISSDGGGGGGGGRPERPTVTTNMVRQPLMQPPPSADGTIYGNTPHTTHAPMQIHGYQPQQPQHRGSNSSSNTSPPSHHQNPSPYNGGYPTNGNLNNNVNGNIHSPIYQQQSQQQQPNGQQQFHPPMSLQLHQPQPHHIHPPMVIAYPTSDAQQHQHQHQQYYQQQQHQYQSQGSGDQYLPNLGPAGGTIYETYDNFMWDQLGLPDAHLHQNPAMAVNQLHIPNNPEQLEQQMYGM